MREYKKISKGIIILITCVIIITSISFIALFVSRKEEPKGNGKQLAGTVNYLEESNSIEEVSSTSDKTINEVKENKVALNTESLISNEKEKKANKKDTKEKVTKEEVKKETKKKEVKFEKAKICPFCGNNMKYVYGEMYECPGCGRKEPTDFGKVRDFLDTNGPQPAIVIADATGVSLDVIDGFLKQGRVEIPDGSDVYIKCQRCGTDIRYGR